MTDFSDCQKKVFKSYARPIVHMRRQVEAGRLGMVLGSGLSKSFGLPMWTELVERLAKDPAVKGTPKGWSLPIQDVLIFSGAKFLCPVCGAISLMPGTSSNPAYRRVDVDVKTGKVTGLF